MMCLRKSRRRSLNGSIGFLVALLIAISSAPSHAEEQPQESVQFQGSVPVTLNYLLYLPPGYESRDSWPLLLFLHGAGERGDDLELVKVHGPPKLIAEGQPFPFVVVSPQCAKDQWWQPLELTALLDDIERRYRIDPDRIYVTKLSMGGYGTWSLAAYAPNRFAAIAPICGGGETFWTRRMKDLPVWAFHGAEDSGVPLERSQEMVDELQRREGDARLTVYPQTGHLSWIATYNNPELYGWLLQHRRTEAEATVD